MCNTYTILSISLPADCSETSTHYIFVQLNKSNYYDLSKLSTQVTSYQLLEGQLNLSIRVSAGTSRVHDHTSWYLDLLTRVTYDFCVSRKCHFHKQFMKMSEIGWKYFKVTAAVFFICLDSELPYTGKMTWKSTQIWLTLPYFQAQICESVVLDKSLKCSQSDSANFHSKTFLQGPRRYSTVWFWRLTPRYGVGQIL